jgi:hypothetical protein
MKVFSLIGAKYNKQEVFTDVGKTNRGGNETTIIYFRTSLLPLKYRIGSEKGTYEGEKVKPAIARLRSEKKKH